MKSSKFIMIVAVGVLIALAGASYFVTFAEEAKISPRKLAVEKLVIETKDGQKHNFDVEIADTPVAMEVGLMYRESLEPDHGMLFELGQRGLVRFWMKNTFIPLDMLFIDIDGTIKKIHENAVPESLSGIRSDVPVSGVLEIKGGRAKELGIQAGDKVVHPYFETIIKQYE